ncbi:UNVERIFIED_CONTAM: Photosystem I reaction center subunit II, chloroplastic [Sesamum latifolium]|uniref:Photosystem I reaction center subunit II, chloroplastic n=1 Tax=Sesamum latifolium TaxID=2727402 RepID=A0AAW2XST8_9LAMI
MKGASALAHRPIRAMAEEAPPATKEPEAPAGFTPPELDPNTRPRSSAAALVDFCGKPKWRSST